MKINQLFTQLLPGTLSVCLMLSCSDVHLSYGIGSSGVTSIADRNRNSTSPAALQEFSGRQLQPTPSPSPHTGSNEGGRAAALPGPQLPVAPQLPVKGSNNKDLQIRLLPGGPIFLQKGESKEFTVQIVDAEGHLIDPATLNLVWQAANGQLIEVNGHSIKSLADIGNTTLSIFIKDQPDIRLDVPVTVTSASSTAQSHDGNFKIRIVPAGPILLPGFASSQSVTILLEDLDGKPVDLTKHQLIWTLADNSQAFLDGNRVVSKVQNGATTLKVALQEDPDTWIQVNVLISTEAAPSGGGGGGGGGAVTPPAPTPTPAPTATPVPKDNVTGIVTFE